jgi:hypothetical protein
LGPDDALEGVHKRRRKRMKGETLYMAVVIGVLSLAAAAVACEDGQSQQELEAQACEDLSNLDNSLASLDASLRGDSTVGEVRDAAENAASAFDKARSSVNEVAETRINDVESAVNSLRNTVEDLPDDASLSEAASAIASELGMVEEAVVGVGDQLECP